MKIRKRTILWFIAAAFLCYCTVTTFTAKEEEKSDLPERKDAIFVEDAKVIPENEGKLIVISGIPEIIEGAVDPQAGVSFDSPYVSRSIEQLVWDDISKKWRKKEINSLSKEAEEYPLHLSGKMKIGEFEIDEELMYRLNPLTRNVEKQDFDEKEIASMEKTGYLIDETTTLWYSQVPSADEDFYTEMDHILYPEWDGAVLIRWNIWEPKEEEGFTMVGVQKGNTLTYTELGDTLLPVEQKIMDEKTYQEMIEPYEHQDAVKYAYLVMTVLCCVMGVKSLRKKEKKNQ